jgi:hypothetical protein
MIKNKPFFSSISLCESSAGVANNASRSQSKTPARSTERDVVCWWPSFPFPRAGEVVQNIGRNLSNVSKGHSRQIGDIQARYIPKQGEDVFESFIKFIKDGIIVFVFEIKIGIQWI